MTRSIALALLAVSVIGCAAAHEPARTKRAEGPALRPAEISAEDALARLRAGNARFRDGHLEHPDQGAVRMHQVEGEQHPFAAVLSCADSRVPPEIVFDEGLGDLFVVREAGHVAGAPTLGSIEYAVEHLGVHLVVVLGHEQCGAVSAAVAALARQREPEGHILSLVDLIAPALADVPTTGPNAVPQAVRANVDAVVATLRASHPILAHHLEDGSLKVVGGVYDLHTGAIEWR